MVRKATCVVRDPCSCDDAPWPERRCVRVYAQCGCVRTHRTRSVPYMRKSICNPCSCDDAPWSERPRALAPWLPLISVYATHAAKAGARTADPWWRGGRRCVCVLGVVPQVGVGVQGRSKARGTPCGLRAHTHTHTHSLSLLSHALPTR